MKRRMTSADARAILSVPSGFAWTLAMPVDSMRSETAKVGGTRLRGGSGHRPFVVGTDCGRGGPDRRVTENRDRSRHGVIRDPPAARGDARTATGCLEPERDGSGPVGGGRDAEVRRLRVDRRAGPGGDGGHLQGAGRPFGSDRGAQDHPGRTAGVGDLGEAVPLRGRGGGRLRPPRHRADLRDRRAGGRVLLRDGLHRGDEPGAPGR